MKQHNGSRIERVIAFLSRERAQAKPDTTVTLSVISGSSVLAFSGLSNSAANVITGVVRLFF